MTKVGHLTAFSIQTSCILHVTYFKCFRSRLGPSFIQRSSYFASFVEQKNRKGPMSGYTIVTYQINTSYISDSKGNCVNIKLIIIKGQLFSIPKYPGQACSERQVTELNSDCSRKARIYPY